MATSNQTQPLDSATLSALKADRERAREAERECRAVAADMRAAVLGALADGYTRSQLAEALGVKRQRVTQIAGRPSTSHGKRTRPVDAETLAMLKAVNERKREAHQQRSAAAAQTRADVLQALAAGATRAQLAQALAVSDKRVAQIAAPPAGADAVRRRRESRRRQWARKRERQQAASR